MKKWFLILILLICIGGAFLHFRSDATRRKNLPPPSEKDIAESKVIIDCGTVFIQRYSNLEVFGNGRVRSKSNKTKGEAVSGQIDVEKYKQLILHAYEVDLFALSKLKSNRPSNPDGGGCSITFVVSGKTTKVYTSNLEGHPMEFKEMNDYIDEWYKSNGINF